MTEYVARIWSLLGSALFLVVAPGTVAGLIPYRLTGWRVERPLPGLSFGRLVGAALIVVGVASLVESFLRFALKGLGTPAPVAPPSRLVVSGQYCHVRNPMYVAVLAIVLGQSLVLGSTALLGYAGLLAVLFHAFVVVYEEPKLTAQFGSSYQEYQAHVSRWWPRIRPWRG